MPEAKENGGCHSWADAMGLSMWGRWQECCWACSTKFGQTSGQPTLW